MVDLGVDITPVGNVVAGWGFTALAVVIGVAGIVGFWYFAFKKANYKTKVLVVDTTTQPETYYRDRGAIIKDGRTKRTMFHLLKCNVNLNPEFMTVRSDKRGKAFVMVGKYGFKNYAFLVPSVANPSIDFGFSHEDVTWGINQYERSKKDFSQSLLMQVLPYIGLGLLVVAFIVGMYFILDKFEILNAVATNLKETALILRETSGGTTVIS
jgi:hypothetical protein